MNKFAIVFAAAASLFSSASFAQAYIGGAFGGSKLDMNCAGTTSCDTSDTGSKVFAGFHVGKGFSLEATYIDFGKAQFKVSDFDGIYNVALKGKSFGIGGAYTLDFAPSWSATGRLGVASNRAKYSFSGQGLSGSWEESHSAAYYGLGVGFKVVEGLSINAAADFRRFELLGEKNKARLLSIGATYAF